MPTDPILALLYIQLPDSSERVVEIDKPSFSIGRDKTDLILPGSKVSRNHARLLLEEGRIFLIDLKSSNGTFIDGTRLTPNQPVPLAYGQSFSISSYTLRLEPAPQPTPPPKPETIVKPRTSKPKKAPPAQASTSKKPKAKKEAQDSPARPKASQTNPALAARPLPPPPAAPPPPPPSTVDSGGVSDGEPFGLSSTHSRYLQFLPPIYAEHPFLSQFLLAFEGILTPIEQTVDNFDLYLDPRTAPPSFLDQLASWLALALDEKWSLEKRRLVLTEAAELYHRRGTRWSLSRYLEIYTGAIPQIVEPEDQPHLFSVVLRVPAGQPADRATVERIIEASKPAHTRYTLEIFSEKVA